MTKDIQPVELCAKAGDVIFWHCNIMHETTHNLNLGTVRHVLFCRIPHKDQVSFRDEISDDLWKRWAI
jgi:ectoine hydroxylase-related dioxygenase (phytanoyl-CoA dioxygenase family)